MWRSAAALYAGLVEAVFPADCLGCGGWIGSERTWVCGDCEAALQQLSAVPYCPRCGRSSAPASWRAGRCPGCRTERHWNCRGIVRLGAYEPLLRKMVTQLKYAGSERSAECLGAGLAEALQAAHWFDEVDYLIPVPMHWWRRIQRPVDHAAMLARAIHTVTRRPVLRSPLRRRLYAPSQTGLSTYRRRLLNVRGAFEVRGWRARQLRGRTVCIVDNLVVSGATLWECAKVLRRAGAAQVYAAVVASATHGSTRPPTVQTEMKPAALLASA